MTNAIVITSIGKHGGESTTCDAKFGNDRKEVTGISQMMLKCLGPETDEIFEIYTNFSSHSSCSASSKWQQYFIIYTYINISIKGFVFITN